MPWDRDTAVAGVAPVSVKPGLSPTNRRVLAGLNAPTLAPTLPSDGNYTGAFRYLHIDIKLDGGTSAEFKLWRWNFVSGLWKLDTRLGVNGLVTLSTADSANNPYGAIIETAFSERCYLQVVSVVGPPTISAWIGGV